MILNNSKWSFGYKRLTHAIAAGCILALILSVRAGAKSSRRIARMEGRSTILARIHARFIFRAVNSTSSRTALSTVERLIVCRHPSRHLKRVIRPAAACVVSHPGTIC